MSQQNMMSNRILLVVLVILVVVSVVSVGLAAYVSVNPQTVTQTYVSSSFETETSFVTSIETSTSYDTVTSLVTISMGYPYAQNCYYYGCPSPCYYCSYNSDYNSSPCLSAGFSNAAQCSGVLFQYSVGCVELVIPVYSGYGGVVYQYYTLHNLPSSYPPIGSWVTVTGQLHQGYNVGNAYGVACPGNYIDVNTIS